MSVHPTQTLSLSQYLIEEQLKLPQATGDFTALMSHLVYAAKIVPERFEKRDF
ncbi:hypothetical protein LEP1GSC150_3858 [Leptospira interrogans serovar Copenhageni str. LT2050]|uniref:Uncharacterized protein n=1 Tax=Leptospira interrogans serovar Copenhageni str. LT2050 TaxID=1001598 RepID=M3G2E3_LEPIT|nr:hypothetical protein LEP1GSC150_3858 [Leptospira interrogans serovar Copenhageni str. LT2050]